MYRDAEWQRRHPVLTKVYDGDDLVSLGEHLVHHKWVDKKQLGTLFAGVSGSVTMQFQIRYQLHTTTGGYFLRHHVPIIGRSSRQGQVMFASAGDRMLVYVCQGANTGDYVAESLRNAKCTARGIVLVRDRDPSVLRMVFYVFMAGNTDRKGVHHRTLQLGLLLRTHLFTKNEVIVMLNEHSAGTMFTLTHGFEHCYKTQIIDTVGDKQLFYTNLLSLLYFPYHLCFIIRGGRSSSRAMISACRIHYGRTFFQLEVTRVDGTIEPEFVHSGKISTDRVKFNYMHSARGPIIINRLLTKEDLTSITADLALVKKRRGTVMAVKLDPVPNEVLENCDATRQGDEPGAELGPCVSNIKLDVWKNFYPIWEPSCSQQYPLSKMEIETEE